jgi:hypothetical protein
MSSLTLAPAVPLRFGLLEALLERQRSLALYGLFVLLLAVPVVMMQATDPRVLESGVSVWVKPAKFLVSVGVFSLTSAWFFGYVRPERRAARPLRAAVTVAIVSASLELAWIGWQASQGLESHFNTGSLFHGVMYALMGLFAVLLIATTLPLAWEIARRPAAGVRPDLAAGVVIGLVMTFVLGSAMGSYMSAQAGHAVGLDEGRVAVFGWNRSGGDLRIAHFLGIHAEQALPILAALVAPLNARLRWMLILVGAAVYGALTLAVFLQAAAGRPLLPL